MWIFHICRDIVTVILNGPCTVHVSATESNDPPKVAIKADKSESNEGRYFRNFTVSFGCRCCCCFKFENCSYMLQVILYRATSLLVSVTIPCYPL